MLNNIKSYIRLGDWIDSKVPMMLAVQIYFFLLNQEKNTNSFLINFISYMLFICMFLAVSYVVNDLSDIEVDKKAGKKKLISQIPKWGVYVSILFMVIVGNIPILYASNWNILCLLCIIIIYFFGIAYSIPLFRFKEKGIVGLIECAIAQRCMPLLIIPFIENVDYIYLTAWMIISFFNGIRYILIHQILDLENDIKSGVKTFVTTRKGNYKKLICILFALEIICSIILCIPLIEQHKIITLLSAILYIFIEYSIYVVLKKYAKKEWLVTFDSVPLEALYNIYMPILFAIYGLFYDRIFLVIIAVILLLTYKSIKIKYGIVKKYVDSIYQTKSKK